MLYPNPTSSELFLQLKEQQEDAQVLILDLKGAVLLQEPLKGNRTTLQVGHLASGTYIVSVRSNTSIENQIFVKQD